MASAASTPLEIASTLQTASVNRHPSAVHDINPSTAASQREPVAISSSPVASEVAEDEIPLSVLNPQPRRHTMPPLPDLRFEQSYLKSISKAETTWGIAWITIRDQVFFPLLQGVIYTLLISGWRYWNRDSKFGGHQVGARIRRWWWGINNWTIPGSSPPSTTKAGLRNQRLARDIGDMSSRFMRA